MSKGPMLILFLSFVVFLSCQQQIDVAAEEEAIKAVIKLQDDAWKNRSLEGEATAWAHEPYIFRGAPSRWTQVGWDSLSNWYKMVFERSPEPLENYNTTRSNYHIHISGNAAWAIYDQSNERVNEQGEKQTSKAYQIRCLEKKTGQWKVVLQTAGQYPDME